MITLFHLIVGSFYFIWVMNQLSRICYDFFCSNKNGLLFFQQTKIIAESRKKKNHNVGGKEKAAEYYIKNKGPLKEKAKTINKYRNQSQKEKEAKNGMEIYIKYKIVYSIYKIMKKSKLKY